MCDVIEEIARSDSEALELILQAVLRRYTELYPDWEVSLISLHREDDRNAQIESTIALLQKMKTL